MEFSFDGSVIRINGIATGVNVVMDFESNIWFEGRPLARYLEYVDPKQAIRNNVDDDCKKTVRELCGDNYTGHPGAIYINEPGFYSLVMKSKLQTAKEFQRWVMRIVLPSIRRTGSFSVQEHSNGSSPPDESSHPPPTLTPHQQTRVDSIVWHDHMTDVLAAELDRINIPVGHKGMFFAKANDMCNRALLNLSCTTDALKKQRGIPKSLSIPSVCSERQLVDLNMIRMQLANFIRDDSELLTSMTSTDQLDAWFAEKRSALTRMASAGGFHSRTLDHMMSVTEARARAKELTKIRQRYLLKPSTIPQMLTGTPALRLLKNI
jgi:prophage antirepressor-like protein